MSNPNWKLLGTLVGGFVLLVAQTVNAAKSLYEAGNYHWTLDDSLGVIVTALFGLAQWMGRSPGDAHKVAATETAQAPCDSPPCGQAPPPA